jgi:CheY-like chemotaxis protein
MGQLTLCGTEPVCASSADEAITLMHQAANALRPFEAALVDHQMPGCDGARFGQMINSDEQLRTTRLILLTSSGQRGDGNRFAELGFAGYLLKPVIQRDLTDCLSIVLAAKAEVWHMQSQPIITRHALRSHRGREKHHILLAEDNAVNQKVACRTLEKLGYRVDIASNGRAAVDGWQTGRYDLILMDCQMPVLDGYEATREIRSLEQQHPEGKHIPIVALTAHAMKGADQQCQDAGMDAYLSKPIDRAQLEACLEKFLGSSEPPIFESTVVLPESFLEDTPPVQWSRLLAVMDGDETLARELATLFVSSGRMDMNSIIDALQRGDYLALSNRAHSLKGASANLHATAASHAAERLEMAARSGDEEQVQELTRVLSSEVQRAIEFLQLKVG